MGNKTQYEAKKHQNEASKKVTFQNKLKKIANKKVPFRKGAKNQTQIWYHFKRVRLKNQKQKWYHLKKMPKIRNINGTISQKCQKL